LAVGAGFYTQWSFLVGAPLHWIAVLSETPATSYVGSATLNQRDSFTYGGQSIPSDDTVQRIAVKAWLQWGGSPLPISARVFPFYRYGNVDVEAATEWFVPPPFDEEPTIPGPVLEMPEIDMPLLPVGQLIPSTGPLNRLAPQFGIRNNSPRRVHCHALKVRVTSQPYSDRRGLVGRAWWRK